jgi:hypothetical protein
VVKGDVQRLQAAFTPPEELSSAVARLSSEMKRLPPPSRPSLQVSGQMKHIPPPAAPVESSAQRDKKPASEPDGHADNPAAARGSKGNTGNGPDENGVPPGAEDPFQWREINQNLRIGYRRAS